MVETTGNAVRLIGKAGQPYDVIAERDGRLFRVAVKTTQVMRARRTGARDAYCFTVNRRRPGKRLAYTRTETDVVALVTLDTKRVGYLNVDVCPQVVWVFADNALPNERRFGPRVSCMRRFEQLGLEDALRG
jgi:hypothetical protein